MLPFDTSTSIMQPHFTPITAYPLFFHGCIIIPLPHTNPTGGFFISFYKRITRVSYLTSYYNIAVLHIDCMTLYSLSMHMNNIPVLDISTD